MSDIIAKTFTESTAWNGWKYTSAARIPSFTPPSSLSVTPSGSTNAVTWTNGTPSAQTRLYRSPTQNGTYTLLATVNAGVSSYNDTGLADGTYWYRAEHIFSSSVSNATSVVSGTISGVITGGGSGGASLSGGVLTLSGSGFPAKTRAAPVWWDTFAGAADGSTLNLRAPLVDNANGTDTWSGTQRGTGARPSAMLANSRVAGKPSAYHPITSNNYNCSLDVRHTLPDAQAPVYTSFWWRSDPDGFARQTKPFAIYGNRSGATFPEFYIGCGNYESFPDQGYANLDGGLRTSTQELNPPYSIPNTRVNGPVNWNNIRGRYLKFELVLVQSDQATDNGLYACRVYDPDNPNGASTSTVFRSGFRTRDVDGAVWRQFCYGHYGALFSSTNIIPNRTDDIILDDSADHVRVVMGNSADYAACTRMEDQPATAWSSSSISCTFNKGGFTTGQTGHVFIVTGAGHSGHGASTYIGSVIIP